MTAQATAPVVDIRGLHKSFGPREVLKGVDLTIAPGEVVCVIGPSGSGKSTLLRCVNQLETATAGSVEVLGTEITDPDVDIDAVRSQVGMVFQGFNLFAHLTVLENCTVAQRKVLRRSKDEAKRIALENLERVGLGDRGDAHPHQLSGGQQQRVAIARALITKPDVVFADEPTGNLVSRSGREVLELLAACSREHGQSIAMVTHDAIAASHADRVLFLGDGRIVSDHPRQSAEQIASYMLAAEVAA